MRGPKSVLLLASALVLAAPAVLRGAGIPTPSAFLGMTVGADRTLADYREVCA